MQIVEDNGSTVYCKFFLRMMVCEFTVQGNTLLLDDNNTRSNISHRFAQLETYLSDATLEFALHSSILDSLTGMEYDLLGVWYYWN